MGHSMTDPSKLLSFTPPATSKGSAKAPTWLATWSGVDRWDQPGELPA